jgi:hypothetical protein
MTATQTTRTRTVYDLEGTLLEACSCGVLCPCWIGEDPDGGECFAANAYQFKQGLIGDVDVSGLSIVNVVHIPGNVLRPGSWRLVMLVDSGASDAQRDALVAAYSGKLGGPLADLAQLVGEVIAVRQVPIGHSVSDGKGTLHVEGMLHAEMEPYRGGDGTITTLRDSLFSTVPGSPAYVSKASRFEVNLPEYGLRWEFEGRNAIQSDYHIAYQA